MILEWNIFQKMSLLWPEALLFTKKDENGIYNGIENGADSGTNYGTEKVNGVIMEWNGSGYGRRLIKNLPLNIIRCRKVGERVTFQQIHHSNILMLLRQI